MSTHRALRGEAFSRTERAGLLDRFRAAWLAREAAESAENEPEEKTARAAMRDAARAYESAVPIVDLSRCPFSGEVFSTSLDIFGLDGLWWAYEYDYRPYVNPVETYFAWTGSLKVEGPLPEWSLKEMVGPEAPFVLPRILDHPDIRAVISTVLIGEHVGMPVVYYASPMVHDLERVDDWGHMSHQFLLPDGRPTSAHAVEADRDKDFELGPWIQRGKLLWIVPGDGALRLRTGLHDCPFLELPGERRRRYIQDGDTWFGSL